MIFFYFRATEPSHFPIQFLCNNIHRPHITTYEYLGTIDYNEEHRTKITFRNNVNQLTNLSYFFLLIIKYFFFIDMDRQINRLWAIFGSNRCYIWIT